MENIRNILKDTIYAHPDDIKKAVKATTPKKKKKWQISLIAQLVERLAVNQNVRGSSPRQGAMYSYIFRNRQRLARVYGMVAQSAEAIDLKSIKCGFESHSSYQYSLN